MPLHSGESPMPCAPVVHLRHGVVCIPQHFLRYRHTLKTVEKVVLDTTYDARYLVFASEDVGGVYIQIGIIGYDNYRTLAKQPRQKIVYGRKWRVEPQLPTSEIIQTIFLALQKAREHEVRERLRFHHDGAYTTPFNNHQDLPLMAQNAAALRSSQADMAAPLGRQTLGRALRRLTYDEAELRVRTLQTLSDGAMLVQLGIQASPKSQLPEVTGNKKGDTGVSFILPEPSLNTFYHGLMEALVQMSHRHVEEHFYYRGFARFSRKNKVMAIATLSAMVRQRPQDKGFARTFADTNYETDSTRVPHLKDGELATQIRARLRQYGALEGILPSGS